VSQSVPPATSPWRPTTGSRYVVAGARTTALVVLLFAVHGLLAGQFATGYWLTLAAGVVLAVPGFLPGRLARIGEALSPWWSYAWTLVGIAIMTGFVLVVAPSPVETWTPLWALAAVNTGFSLPLRGQVVLHPVALSTLTIVLVTGGAGASSLVAHLGLYVVLAAVVANLSRWMRTESSVARASRETAERVSRLLEALARMNALDLEDTGEAAVRAMADLGYEMATFGLIDGGLLRSVADVGFSDRVGIDQPIPAEEGLAGLAARERRTVVLDDYRSWEGAVEGREEVRGAVAVPVELDGEVRAVLVGASRTSGAPGEDELAVIEVLAAQATRVLRTSRQYQEERRLAHRLAELDGLKRDFIASVSHELRTPMTIITGVGETLSSRGDELTATQRASLLDRLSANADRLDGLIGALLDLSRLEAGAVEVARRGVSLSAIVEAGIERLDHQLDRHQVRVSVPDVEVDVDPSLLAHVVASLVGNAAKHTPAGSTVWVTAEGSSDGIAVRVEDDGPGIDPADLPHLTDRFYRGGPSLRRTVSGLGLGLAVVSSILAEHDSALEIGRSERGGAAFGFVLAPAPSRVEI
jgi:K+-sensing histidine kinase KdpD